MSDKNKWDNEIQVAESYIRSETSRAVLFKGIGLLGSSSQAEVDFVKGTRGLCQHHNNGANAVRGRF